MDSKSLPALNAAVDKLMTKLVTKQEQLRREESRLKGWSPIRCNKLRAEIDSLEKRLAMAERLQEKALGNTEPTSLFEILNTSLNRHHPRTEA